jgi:hypothetical protein
MLHSLTKISKYLAQHGPFESQHNLSILARECIRVGLPISSHLLNPLDMMENENSKHGFRYFLFEGTGRPSLSYLSEAVDRIMETVTLHLKPFQDADDLVLKTTIGKPVSK